MLRLAAQRPVIIANIRLALVGSIAKTYTDTRQGQTCSVSFSHTPAMNSSNRSVTPGLLLCGLAKGLIDVGCSSTNVGCVRDVSHRDSNRMLSMCPQEGAVRSLGRALRRVSPSACEVGPHTDTHTQTRVGHIRSEPHISTSVKCVQKAIHSTRCVCASRLRAPGSGTVKVVVACLQHAGLCVHVRQSEANRTQRQLSHHRTLSLIACSACSLALTSPSSPCASCAMGSQPHASETSSDMVARRKGDSKSRVMPWYSTCVRVCTYVTT